MLRQGRSCGKEQKICQSLERSMKPVFPRKSSSARQCLENRTALQQSKWKNSAWNRARPRRVVLRVWLCDPELHKHLAVPDRSSARVPDDARQRADWECYQRDKVFWRRSSCKHIQSETFLRLREEYVCISRIWVFWGKGGNCLLFSSTHLVFDTCTPNSLYGRTHLRPPGDQFCVGNQMAVNSWAAIFHWSDSTPNPRPGQRVSLDSFPGWHGTDAYHESHCCSRPRPASSLALQATHLPLAPGFGKIHIPDLCLVFFLPFLFHTFSYI